MTYETKIFDLEMQIDNLNRKMAYLQIDKAAADNARIDVLHYPSTAPQEELTKSHKS